MVSLYAGVCVKRLACILFRLWFLYVATGVVGVPTSAQAQLYGELPDYQANLSTCLKGTYPALCNHGVLSADEAQRVRAAEYQANLSTCLRGTYPALCRHGVLSADEAQRVRAAEYQANLSTCLKGTYPALCRHGVLSADDAERVRAAEYQANLSTCLKGTYPALCNHGVLSADDAQLVNGAEIAANTISARRQPTQSLYSPALAPTNPHCAENGSCYGDISALTGRPKTVPVEGYYRKDGTYVRGHYRSKPR